MSIQSFEAAVTNWFVETEQEVVTIVGQIKAGLAVVESDIDAGLKWVAGQTPNIAAGLQTVVGLVEQIGMSSNPEVAVAIAAANTAVTALNAFASAENSGASNAQALVSGYIAVKSAQASVAAASVAAVKA